MWGGRERERETPGGKLDHRAPSEKEAGGRGKGGLRGGGVDMREGDKQS